MSKKEEEKIYTYYEIQGNKIARRPKKCPRCGVFMALHKKPVPRWTCGACSYTEYMTTEKAEKQ